MAVGAMFTIISVIPFYFSWLQVLQLQNEIEEVNQEYVRLLAELRSEDGSGGKSAGTEVKNEKV